MPDVAISSRQYRLPHLLTQVRNDNIYLLCILANKEVADLA